LERFPARDECSDVFVRHSAVVGGARAFAVLLKFTQLFTSDDVPVHVLDSGGCV
jgi:hypothetical protein